MKPSEAAAIGLPVVTGVKDYVMTSDEYLYTLSENKKKLLQNIQDLMKTSAVDCQINQYENEEDGLGCIVLPGNPEQYAYHPILSKDIAETSTQFKETSTELVPVPLAAPGEAPAPAAAATNPLPAKKTVKAFVITVGSTQYIAVPVLSRTGTALSYDLFARGDTLRSRKIGTAIADAEGKITNDIVLF
jgi:hypothetical protein